MSTPSQGPDGHDQGSTGERGAFDQVAEKLARRSGMKETSNKQIDVMAAIGGPRGIVESAAPSLVFLMVFTFTRELTPALIGAVGLAAVFTLWRLIERRSVVQAIAGLGGVVICALFADVSDQPLNYYVPGFFINLGSIVVFVASIFLRWPIIGMLFGLLRNEGTEWRDDPVRLKAYRIATWLLVGMFALRLVVQVPLYFAENLVALGATRLIMGIPLYALTLWLAWMVSRPGTQKTKTKTAAPA